jgi:cytochrome c biogenesis protein CcdA
LQRSEKGEKIVYKICDECGKSRKEVKKTYAVIIDGKKKHLCKRRQVEKHEKYKMRALLFLIAFALVFGLRTTLSLFTGGLIGYLMGYLFVLAGTGTWVIPFLTLVMAFALSKKIRNLLDNLFY